MAVDGRCEVHQLARGADGLCVLCRRELSIPPLDAVTASPAASTRVGLVVTLGGLALLTAVGVAGWRASNLSLGGDADTRSPITAVTEVPIVSAPDPDEALRAAERERITKADIWKTLPALTNTDGKDAAEGAPTTLPDALPVVPVPSLPAAIVSASEQENQRRLAIEEARRDEARHAAIASAMEKRAEEQRREHQAAAVAEAREKVRIVMYGAPWCGGCRSALAYMHDKRINFTDHNIEMEPSARTALQRLNPKGSIPTFQMDDDVVVGFGERSFERALDTAARRRAGL